ncbi:MAG: phosphatase PAP2 family protein [Actinomycetota bacterium]
MSTREPAADLGAQSGSTSRTGEHPDRAVGWRPIAAGPLVAGFTLVAALVVTAQADFTFRDPDHVAALYVVEVGAGVALLVWLDIFLRARRLTGKRRPSREAMGTVRRERWTPKRMAAVAGAIVAFYVTYLAYRNLKAAVPLLRPGDLFDRQLAEIDQAMFFGSDPAVLLHDLLGTGISADILSTFYVAFIVFLPLSLGLALVFAERLQVGLVYATALSINWVLGAASYFLLPALGPIYYDPATFSVLPHTEVAGLQELLMDDRVRFLANTDTGTPQAIAAFASLHIAMSFTALLAAYMLNLGRRVKQALWAWLALSFLATIYLGWHYVLDDVAGMLIGAAALVLARMLTGFDPARTCTRGPAFGGPSR